MFGLIAAALIGAGLGLERHLRGVAPKIIGCTLAGVGGWLVAFDLLGTPYAQSTLFFAVIVGVGVVGLLFYLVEAMQPAAAGAERIGAYVAPAAFGLMLGFNAERIVGAMMITTVMTLAWRSLANERQNQRQATLQAAPTSGAPVVLVFGRPEEGRDDDECRKQGEEQGNRQ
jgi:hypothetical protein